jgi:hypothetical protein
VNHGSEPEQLSSQENCSLNNRGLSEGSVSASWILQDDTTELFTYECALFLKTGKKDLEGNSEICFPEQRQGKHHLRFQRTTGPHAKHLDWGPSSTRG